MAKKTEKRNEKAEETAKKNKAEEAAAEEKSDAQVEAEAEGEEINEPEASKVMDAADVNAELIKLEDEKEEFKNALIRERADFENYKKRNAELSASSYKNGVADTASEILPVLDNFERALAAECADTAFLDGMKMIMRQLEGVLAELGVQKIDTDGQFNPEFHNAVLQVDEEGFEPNQIVETMQNGYMLKDKILRHAMVKVNK